jgi:hypothetical protein
LFLHYGFIDEENGKESVLLTVEFDENDPFYDKKIELFNV